MRETPEHKLKKNREAAASAKKGRSFIYHIHPPKVAETSIRFDRTFGLGGMALLLFLIQALTGVLLRFAYVPTPAEAYDSILLINESILFGRFVRNIHHWSGILMVIVTFLHFIRTFYAQAYYDVRKVNWLLGMALLIVVVFSNFTGYLLPWDQLSYWAVTVATNMLEYFPLVGDKIRYMARGGNEVGSATLLNFYTYHTGVLPTFMVIIMIYHFWKVRKAKGVAIPETKRETVRVPADPDLLFKELVVGLILISIVLLLSVFFHSPLQERANPAFSPNPAKAPWYFMGIQELLLHIHPFFSAILLPLMFFGALVYLPYFRWNGYKSGQWFHSALGKKLAIESGILAFMITPLVVLADEYFFRFKELTLGIPQVVSQGVIPFLVLTITLGGFVVYLRKGRKADAIEITVAMFTVFIVSYIVLTIIGIWFRGAGMNLMWPWNL